MLTLQFFPRAVGHNTNTIITDQMFLLLLHITARSTKRNAYLEVFSCGEGGTCFFPGAWLDSSSFQAKPVGGAGMIALGTGSRLGLAAKELLSLLDGESYSSAGLVSRICIFDGLRSESLRGGYECVSQGYLRWTPQH